MDQRIINIELKGEYRFKPEIKYEVYKFRDPDTGRRVSIFASSYEEAWERLEERCPRFWEKLVYDGV